MTYTEANPLRPDIDGPLHTFHETPQEAYDKIRAYFSAPGATLGMKEGDGASCAYRVPETGARCAVGCLIPDEHYDPVMDDGKFVWREQHDPETGEDFEGPKDIDTAWTDMHEAGVFDVDDDRTAWLLGEVQSIHDSSQSVDQFLERLDDFAAGVKEIEVAA